MENEKIETAAQDIQGTQTVGDETAPEDNLNPIENEFNKVASESEDAEQIQKKNKRANIVIIVLLALALLGVILAVWAKSLPSTNLNNIISLL